MIRLDGVTFTYPEAADPALRHLDLEVDEGDLLLVAGPSGSGKSTLLRVPCGLVPHYSGGMFSGRVFVGGRDVTGAPPREAAGTVGFVPQDPEAHATADRVMPELSFALENLGTPPTVMRRRIEEVLDQLGIAHLRDRRLDTLSGGERQRVAVAAVLAVQPKVLICDEPTSALDPRSAEDVLQVLVRLRDELGLTVLLSEHRLERVAGAADGVAYLDGGTALIGDPRDVFGRTPAAPPVSEIGRRMGWTPLPLTVREGRRFARSVQVPPPHRQPHTPGEPLVVADGIRVTLGRREVLRDASLELRRGEVTALVGRNGSGKTTLVRTMAGLIEPSGGRVVRCGPLAEIGARDWARRVAYVPQRAEALLYRDSVRDELHASAPLAEIADDWLRRLGLLEVASQHPWLLSAGQRLRCALATAFVRAPDVYLLDEPTRGMDPQAKDDLASILDTESERGAAVLLVTHDVELVARAAHRVVMLAEGENVASGPTADVLGESVLFSSQTSKVMGDPRFLVPDDVVVGVRS